MSRFFIRRPIAAMVLSIFLVLFGLLVLRGIPVAEYPDITPPMIKISAAYSGANALDVEASVATPIEQDRKSTRLNSSHLRTSRMPSSA